MTSLPKAHLHLHFTGALRPSTLLELADLHGVRLPEALRAGAPLDLRATDERGWFRFQRLYDAARAVIRTPEDVHRLLREAAEDDAAEGSGWLEIQVDPTTYARSLGGLTPTVETILDGARAASTATGVGVGVILAANRTRHPLDARTLARLAQQYADRGVVGFGLSNDERRGRARDFDAAFRIARRAGLACVPHGGELAGPASVRDCLDALGADRIGHGVRVLEDQALLERVIARGVTLEICPTSNVALGVAASPAEVPLAALHEAGARIALGADDPLLFGSRLVDQYALARETHGLDDAAVARLARCSIEASRAPQAVRDRLLAGVEEWRCPSPATASSPPAPARA